MSEEYYYMPGATVVGIKASDGVVLAAEKRVSYGFYMMSKAGKKVYLINDRAALAAAGIIADMQTLLRVVKYNVRLYELNSNLRLSVRGIAKLLSNILFNKRTMPYIVEVVVGGVDEEGPHIFVLDALGSLIEDKFTALGTGAKIAIGILEDEYRDDISVREARDLAVKVLERAISRDPVSGDGIDIAIVTKEGAREESIRI